MYQRSKLTRSSAIAHKPSDEFEQTLKSLADLKLRPPHIGHCVLKDVGIDAELQILGNAGTPL